MMETMLSLPCRSDSQDLPKTSQRVQKTRRHLCFTPEHWFRYRIENVNNRELDWEGELLATGKSFISHRSSFSPSKQGTNMYPSQMKLTISGSSRSQVLVVPQLSRLRHPWQPPHASSDLIVAAFTLFVVFASSFGSSSDFLDSSHLYK